MSAELTNYEDCMHELNELRGIILSLNNNCTYQGKDRDGAVLYSFEPGFDAQLSFSWANSHIKAIENFLKEHTEPAHKSEEIELLEWIDAHPATANRLESVTMKSGASVKLRERDSDPAPVVTIPPIK